MKTEPRIRSRSWMARGRLYPDAPARSPWRRVPLSLIFRRKRTLSRFPAVTITKTVAAAHASGTIMRLERHIHHTYADSRIFTPGARDILVHHLRMAILRTVHHAPVPNRLSSPPDVRLQREQHSLHVDRLTHRDRLTNFNNVLNVRKVEHHISLSAIASAETAPITYTLQRPLHRPATQFRQSPMARPDVFVTETRHIPASPMTTSETISRIRPPSIAHRLGRAIHRSNAPIADRPPAFRSHLSRPNDAPIVWRSVPRHDAQAESESPVGYPVAGTTSPPASTSYSRNDAVPSGPAVAVSPAPATLKLDGPVMDRLAEDVMRRIDKRMRIERERRGMS